MIILIILAIIVYIRFKYVSEEKNRRDYEQFKQTAAAAAVGLTAGTVYAIKHGDDSGHK